MFKFSQYNKIWKINSNSLVVFNSLSNAVIVISQAIYTSLLKKEWENISDIVMKSFIDAYILIPENIESKDIFIFEMLNIKSKKERLGIFIVPSRACNLECTYCMQNNLFANKLNTFITRDIIDKYYDWIQTKLSKWGVKRLDIVFYGGEPLTSDESILSYIFDKFDTLEIQPVYGMITNGINLLKHTEIMSKMNSIQITIDGNKETHDKRRVFKDKSGTYDLILHNIIKYLSLSKENTIILRMNIDKNNRDTLLEDLKEVTSQLPMNQIEVSLNPVDPYSRDMNDEKIHGDIRKTAKAISNAYGVLKRDYGTEPYIWRLNCGVSSLCQWSFDTEGSIYKCPALTGEPDKAVSNVNDPYLNASFYKTMNNITSDEECLNCCYLGYCYGGCVYQNELTGSKSCKKDFFDEYIPIMMELKYNLKNDFR